MTWLGKILYCHAFAKSDYGPGKSYPYELVSSMHLWKLQHQAYYMDVTIGSIIKGYAVKMAKHVKWKVEKYIFKYKFKHGFYYDGEKLLNKTDKVWYEHKEKGMYKMCMTKPCMPNCLVCKKQEKVYN